MLRPAVGTRIAHYRLLDELGRGGMGEVYLALDERLDRQVALKVLPAERTTDVEAHHRLLREARAAAALDHPNICAVYEVGESDGQTYLALQRITGETLAARMRRGQLPRTEASRLAIQIVDALAEAHRLGIVHRDVKPQNVMIDARGQVKVLDFGLARPSETAGGGPSLVTAEGTILGTVPYMSPEQLRGERAEATSDVFSLGIVLVELFTGQHPFPGGSNAEVIAAILAREPALDDLPSDLREILERALQRDRRRRYPDAGALLADLRTFDAARPDASQATRDQPTVATATIASGAGDGTTAGGRAATRPTAADPSAPTVRMESEPTTPASAIAPTHPARWWRHRRPTLALLGTCLLGAILLAGLAVVRGRQATLERTLAEAGRLADAGDRAAAWDLLAPLADRLPREDPAIAALLTRVTDRLTVTSEPSGARVSLLRFRPGPATAGAPGIGSPSGRPDADTPRVLGTTPLRDVAIASGSHLLIIEADGHVPLRRPLTAPRVSREGVELDPMAMPAGRLEVSVVLRPVAEQPPGMVWVPPARRELASYQRPTTHVTELAGFWIDQHEVTNRQFRAFVDAGGYQRRELWPERFRHQGEEIPYQAAMGRLVDQTGLPGPRGWSQGAPLPGSDDLPVSGITAYEANAYAAFHGNQLPTLFQWEQAAREGFSRMAAYVMPWGPVLAGEDLDGRASFASRAPLAVGSFPFGASRFGALDMAGNVAEWCRAEPLGDGFAVTGGSFADPSYVFPAISAPPALQASDRIGFRTVRVVDTADGTDQGASWPADTAISRVRPPPAATLDPQTLASYYRYDAEPLEARIIAETTGPGWRRLELDYAAAAGERGRGYLWLPSLASPPHQVVQLVPAGDVYHGIRPLVTSVEMHYQGLLRGGRAIFAVAFPGFLERPVAPDHDRPPAASVRFRELMVARATDLRRGLDWLLQRDDVDDDRIAYLGISSGADDGFVFTAVEPRYRAAIFISGGYPTRGLLPEVEPMVTAASIAAPKLLLNGRYDEMLSYEHSFLPLYARLPEPKRLVTFDGGHVPELELMIRTVNGFLDETLGPVRR